MSTATLPRGYIDGLITSNDAGDADHDISIAAGEARDADDLLSIRLTSALTKRIDADWAAGSDAGGFPSALSLAADTWYHVFIISNGTRTDAGFDTSLTASNLLSDASGYSYYRRIGSVLTDDSSDILGFYQRGDSFLWKIPIQNTSNYTVWTNNTYSVSTPPLVCRARLAAGINRSPTTIKASMVWPDLTVQNVAMELLTVDGTSSTTFNRSCYLELMTDDSSQIRVGTDTGGGDTGFSLLTLGWYDFRGKQVG